MGEFALSNIQILQEESPPAWIQEAYWLWRTKYSICYPCMRWGTPQGTPPGQVWLGGYPRWGTPCWGTPLARSWWEGTWSGVPPPSGYSHQVWWGWGGGYLRWGNPWLGTPWPGLTGGIQSGGTPVGVPPGQIRLGVPEVGYPCQGTPWPGSTRGTQSGVPPIRLPPARSDWGGIWGGVPLGQVWLGGVVPKLGFPRQGYPPPPSWTWLGYPPTWTWPGTLPLGVDRQNDGQTRVKTLPSRRTTYAVGNYSDMNAYNK